MKSWFPLLLAISFITVQCSPSAAAGALAAMVIDESGYGYTRTALGANNLFGWKFSSTQACASPKHRTPAK